MNPFPLCRLRLIPVFLLLSQPAQAAVAWSALLDQDGGNSVHFGAALDGKDPYRRNESKEFAPASNSKLFTAGALLATYGAEYRYPTLLRWQESASGVASQVTLIGSGDPSWGMPQFGENLRTRVDLFASALKEAGVRTIQGDLVLKNADPRFETVSIPEGWKTGDTLSCGGSLAFGFNLNLNCATYRLVSPNEGAWQSQGLHTPVLLSVSTGSSTNLQIKLVKGANSTRFAISGTLKKGDTRSFTLPVFETTAWAKALFRLALENKGIRFEAGGPREIRGMPKELQFQSLPLSELLKPFLKNSINFLGDAFLKTLAMDPSFQGNGELLGPGIDAMREHFLRLGLSRDFTIHDGSGLSRTSRVTPLFLLEYLSRISRENYFPALLAALPLAGIDGTLRNRMKGTAAEGSLRAKTGTLDGVYNLAGYVPRGREYVPFVILTRTTSAFASAARRAEDRVGAKLAELHRGLVASVSPQEAPYPYYPEQAGMDDQ